MPRTPPDPYAVLGVRRGATQQEIAWAYRRLARRHHPDRSPGPGATDRMRRINAAWRTLSDPLERAKLDRAAAVGPKAWSAAPDHRTAGQRRAGSAGWQRQAWRATARPATSFAVRADGSFRESGLAAALVGLGILVLAFAALAVGAQVAA